MKQEVTDEAVHFVHLRAVNARGQVTSNGGVTIAYKLLAHDECAFSWAQCSAKDTFCRRIGRAIASGRLTKSPAHTFVLDHHDYDNNDWPLSSTGIGIRRAVIKYATAIVPGNFSYASISPSLYATRNLARVTRP